MGKKKAQAAILISGIAFSFLSCGYQEEVHTSFKAGKGYGMGDDISFLLNYHLFKKPAGIRRFPDGGLSRTVVEGVFQVRYSRDGEFSSRKISDSRVLDSEFHSLEDRIYETCEEHGEFDAGRTNQLVRRLGPAALGLPSPLDYCKKSRKNYIKDLVELKGDFQYRKEIIRRLDFRPEEAADVLRAMEEHQARLKGVERTEYCIYSEDTKIELRK